MGGKMGFQNQTTLWLTSLILLLPLIPLFLPTLLLFPKKIPRALVINRNTVELKNAG